jgi:hypothetical protein
MVVVALVAGHALLLAITAFAEDVHLVASDRHHLTVEALDDTGWKWHVGEHLPHNFGILRLDLGCIQIEVFANKAARRRAAGGICDEIFLIGIEPLARVVAP